MYKIGKMDIKDYEKIIDLWKNTDGVGLSGNDDSRKSVKKFLKNNHNTCFVVKYKNKEINGTIMAGNDGRRGNIYHLTVKSDHRKNGISKKLLEKTEKSLEKEGIRKIFLVVFKENDIGNKFWEETGYKIREDLYYRDKKIMD